MSTPLPFERKLALNQWMLLQFGADSLEKFRALLGGEFPVGFREENTSEYARQILARIGEDERTVTNDLLHAYDANIVRHWRHVTRDRDIDGRTPHPLYFQYLCLLFAEHYLDRFFSGPGRLRDDLNSFLDGFNNNLLARERIDEFKGEDLNKLAAWIATGGGKTLIMQVNLLQFWHYNRLHKNALDIRRTILLTPNAGLSVQHKRELDLANIRARLFSRNAPDPNTDVPFVEILDIHKLARNGKNGEKTVSVETFESRNLVLVDEGHRGATGYEWMDKRNQLCEHGFSFEYSATFSQAIGAASGSDLAPRENDTAEPSQRHQLIQQYGRCILFDYSYKRFYDDGYGKDHLVLNMENPDSKEQTQRFLTGCTLAFYQQMRLFKDSRSSLAPYMIENPLWVFVGGKVTARNVANPDTISDIQMILRFVARFVRNADSESVGLIRDFMDGSDDLIDRSGQRVFHNAFPYLNEIWKGHPAEAIFGDVLKTVFNVESGGHDIHVVDLKEHGEIGLRVGENDWFGLLNVGDSSKTVAACGSLREQNLVTSSQEISGSLFFGINDTSSPVNLLIGAKKFTEGWSSWRVATIGLMNMGKQEGSEIIQMFGRGVRLRGLGHSLKRSGRMPPPRGGHPNHIRLLETINVFGINASYMRLFEKHLKAEGVERPAAYPVPTVVSLPKRDLSLPRMGSEAPDFRDASRLRLEKRPPEMAGIVTLNWYPKVSLARSGDIDKPMGNHSPNSAVLTADHLQFLDHESIYLDLLRHKREQGWDNLRIERETVRGLLSDPTWYCLLIPAHVLEFSDFSQTEIWREIAVALLKKYMRHYYLFRKGEYERPHLKYQKLSPDDPNLVPVHMVELEPAAGELTAFLTHLADLLRKGEFTATISQGTLVANHFRNHLYQPLFHLQDNVQARISPVPLNEGEQKFLADLKEFWRDSANASKIGIKELPEMYLLRNQSRGSGVGFFEPAAFYPDFILWMFHGPKQHICFVDPKGLIHLDGINDPKIRFHAIIKSIEKRLNKTAKTRNIVLESFIVSSTPLHKVKQWVEPEQDAKEQFRRRHVVFQEDKNYIVQILSMALHGNSNATPECQELSGQ